MSTTKEQGNYIKHQLLVQHRLNLKTFSERYNFNYALVSDVVRGINRCNYGKGKEIKDKIVELIGPLSPGADESDDRRSEAGDRRSETSDRRAA